MSSHPQEGNDIEGDANAPIHVTKRVKKALERAQPLYDAHKAYLKMSYFTIYLIYWFVTYLNHLERWISPYKILPRWDELPYSLLN